ncbi:protein mono-ADP-ribosyltransferase PARP9 [Mugil cephalus]|uniref:protein mono-ADP-ribosyltransferase PARP9 n=1 Tax=Mugil cephalus TaxID=48193 RepID=UPI001FB7BF66|nr:protein mono-ADP-ribosyltransferase PARP9 [Mugil cephalus]
MDCKLDIPLHGSSIDIVKQCGPDLSEILDIKFGCVATFDGVDFESDPSAASQRLPTVTPEERFSVRFSGVKVSVWKADLTNFRADAVVNAANTDLQHWGGLAQALCDAGGPDIQRESKDYVAKNGQLPTGEAIPAKPGSLPCKMLIHAVGPHLSGHSDVTRAEPLLKKVIRNILDLVCEYRLHSVAIPAISSGLFHYPLPQCAETIVSTVKHYCEKSKGYLPTEILLVNNDEPTVKEMVRACQKIFTHQQSNSYGQATRYNTRGAANMPASTFQVGNVQVILKMGHIEDQQTDVIVNTASQDRNLSIGRISKALFNKAGPEMQVEIRNAPPSTVIATRAYRLKCKVVYHTFCTEKKNRGAEKILFDSVSFCLWSAVTSKHKSIAFPAIGTGALEFPKWEVAKIMSEVVGSFAQNFPEKFDVYIVIYPSDHDIFQAFEKEMKLLQKRASNPSFLHASNDRHEFPDKRGRTPQISLSSSSDAATREAEKWLNGLLLRPPSTVDICNNFISHFSDQEQKQVSRLSRKGVSIEEFFSNGHACISVSGTPREDVVVTVLKIETMLCNIHKRFVFEEERELCLRTSQRKLSFERQTVDHSSQTFTARSSIFSRQGLRISKMDEVVNPTLQTMFDLKRNQLNCSTGPRKMLQRIPAQFCEMVSRIGFYAECAPPNEPACGEGIYFASSVEKALEVWREKPEEYLYFVEADVLTGKSTRGKPGLILPPPVGSDPDVLYDSVTGDKDDLAVIFSGYQALPRYIITCRSVK